MATYGVVIAMIIVIAVVVGLMLRMGVFRRINSMKKTTRQKQNKAVNHDGKNKDKSLLAEFLIAIIIGGFALAGTLHFGVHRIL